MSKKIKEESALKKKINEMKKTPKGKAILKLSSWIIFFIILFIFCIVASVFSKNLPKIDNEADYETTENNKTTEQFDENAEKITLLENLLQSNFNYEYKITINDAVYVFNGAKDGEVDSGYKENLNGIIKYYIDKTGTYQETTTNKILITNLYENINSEYINLSSLINRLKNLELIVPENTYNFPTYISSDNINKYSVSFKNVLGTENNYVTNITITSLLDTYEYKLEFKNVEVQNEN